MWLFPFTIVSQTIENLGETIQELRIIGGGAKSKLWCQILADVLGKTIYKPIIGDAGIRSCFNCRYGNAVCLAHTRKAVAHCVKIEQEFTPNPGQYDLYQTYYDIYRDVTHDLARYSHKLATLASSNK